MQGASRGHLCHSLLETETILSVIDISLAFARRRLLHGPLTLLQKVKSSKFQTLKQCQNYSIGRLAHTPPQVLFI